MSGNPHFTTQPSQARTGHPSQQPIHLDFQLEPDESFSYVFDEEQIKMEPENHLQKWFESQSQPEKGPYVKEEALEASELAHDESQSAFQPTLNDYYLSIKEMQNKCRMIQQILLATGKQPIYRYAIGFEAVQERVSGVDSSLGHIAPSTPHQKGPFASNSLKIQEETPHGQPRSARLRGSYMPESRNDYATLLTVVDSRNVQPSTQRTIELVSGCCQKSLTLQEKRKFLELFSKIEGARRGIQQTMMTSYEKDHRCKVCGMQFETGRKLGGHISRKHPGNSFDYLMKKEIRKSKICERNRRKYLKQLQTHRKFAETE